MGEAVLLAQRIFQSQTNYFLSVFSTFMFPTVPYLNRLLSIILLLGVALYSQPGFTQANSIDRALALVGESVITLNEYRTRHRQQRLETTNYPEFSGTVDKDLLDLMINERIQVIEAERRRLSVSDIELDRAVEFVARQNQLSVDQLVAQLNADSFTLAEFRESLRKQQLSRKLIDAVANSRVSVSDQETENYLNSNSELLEEVNDEYEVAHLLISTSGKSDAAIEAEVENLTFIREQIVGGLAFDQAVRDFADSGKEEGGYLGWRAPDQLPELFVKALESMDVDVNNVSKILQSDNGLHLLKLMGRRGGGNQVLQQNIRHILIRPEPNETRDEALQRANGLYQSLVTGESFESVARLHSDDEASRQGGGELGWVNPGQLAPQFEDAASALPLNTVSQPVQTRFGFHLILVEGRRNADMAREIAENKAREAIFRRKASELFKNWFRAVKERTFVEYIGG